jgi:hypothetical protein
LRTQLHKRVLQTQFHGIGATASAPILALANADPNPYFTVDEIQPQAKKANQSVVIQRSYRKEIALRLETFLDTLLDPFLDFFLRIQLSRVSIYQTVKFRIARPARLLLCTKLGLFCGQPDEFSAK